jgi:hypothetical protein
MLSDKAIQALRPDPSRPGSKHHDRDGLYLWVARSGSKTWREDYRWEGVRQTFTIGTYPKVRLADARKVAMQINDWLKEGIDPRTQSSRQRRERERPEAKPFREVAEAWLAHHATAWSPRYHRDMREKLDHFVLPALGPDDQIQVKINGVDVFDPSTGEVRCDEPDNIACWFIDSDYNQESFFVRQAYFLGQNDPYRSFKTSLKAEIDQEAWESLNSDTSVPFAKPSTGRIAVKVINHLGDEVMKVYKV